ncbi:PAS domain S-box protein [Methanobacterium alkalithermotolerans]|uniref:PAS domain S-box protein n=1 Tax=Methanobacterium alkalithermotolerans TaxID=2731220 RepID=A0A8T8K8Y4_9EURY|nr:PAS domain S-box protein [Methanobacterium alkalithermotolerans]QUH23320.1 PAS domain S-box protein [Methanobacterium alkalithermotolerans]
MLQKVDKLEKKVIDQDKLIGDILSTVSEGVISVDNNQNILFLNNAAEKILQRSCGEVLGKNIFDSFPEFKDSLLDEYCSQVLKDNIDISFESYFEKNSYPGWYDIRLTPEGQEIWIFFKNSAKQNEVIKSLQKSEYQYRKIVDSSYEGIMVVDNDLNITLVNSQMAEILESSVPEISGQTIFKVLDNDLHSIALKIVEKTRKGLTHKQDLSFYNKKGSREWIRIYSSPIFGEAQDLQGGLILINIITTQKEVEKKLKVQAREQEAVALLSQLALSCSSLSDLMNKSMEMVKDVLNVDYTKIMELTSGGDKYYLRYGTGWNTGWVGEKLKPVLKDSQASYTLNSKIPVVVNDFSREKRFKITPILKEHGVQSGLSVTIGDKKEPYGILGAHCSHIRKFNNKDVHFVQSVANILAYAVERELMETRLRENEKLYRLLADNAVDMISTHDIEGKYTYASPSSLKLLGYSPEELVGLDAFKIIHPEDICALQSVMADMFSQRSLIQVNYRLRQKGGDYIWVESTAKVVEKDHPGELMEIIVITRDISDRVDTESALKESEAYYRTIFENSGTANIIVEEDRSISLANSQFSALYGASKKEVEGKIKWPSFSHADELKKMEEYHIHRSINPDKVPKSYEFKFVDKYENEKDVHATVSLIPGTRKRVVSLINITEEKKSRRLLEWELKVNKSLARIYSPLVSMNTSLEKIASSVLKESLDLTHSSVGWIGKLKEKEGEMDILVMESASEKEYGKTSLKLGLKEKLNPFFENSMVEKSGFYDNHFQQVFTKEGLTGELFLDKILCVPIILDQEIVGQIVISNPEKEYANHHLQALRRLGEFYALAIQRKQAEQKIEESLQEKKVLLKEIHHRVKNNLQIVSSLLSLQLHYVHNPETQNIFIESQNRVRSMALIHEKLYRSSNLARINFSNYVESLVEGLISSYSKIPGQINVIIDIEDISLNIETAMPCGLIINELVSNSIKHGFKDQLSGEIKIKIQQEKGICTILISDNGSGFPEDIDFKNTNSLGMQLVTSLVSQIDGEIELSTHKGTCFRIIFEEIFKKENLSNLDS